MAPINRRKRSKTNNQLPPENPPSSPRSNDGRESKRRRLEDLEREKATILDEMARENGDEIHHEQVGTSTPLNNNDITGLVENMSYMVNGLNKMAAGFEPRYPRLPELKDETSDFQDFMREFERTTREHNIPLHANKTRLEKVLSGDALTHVKEYLKNPSGVPKAIEELRSVYGTNTNLAKTVMAKCEKLPALGNNMKNLRELYTGASLLEDLVNKAENVGLGEMVVVEIQKKLDTTARMDWGKARLRGATASLPCFLEWFKMYKEAFQESGGNLITTDEKDDRYKSKRSAVDKHEQNRRDREEDWRRESRRTKPYEVNRAYQRAREEDRAPARMMVAQLPARSSSKRVPNVQNGELCIFGCSTAHEKRDCPKLAEYKKVSQKLYDCHLCFRCGEDHPVKKCPIQTGAK